MEEQDESINTKPGKERDVSMSPRKGTQEPPWEGYNQEDGQEKEITTQTTMQDSEEENHVLAGYMK